MPSNNDDAAAAVDNNLVLYENYDKQYHFQNVNRLINLLII